tara:strand:- start:2011 stop:3051 length:1041 start_codon:yes stop_codon:yes gene_type:complete
MKKYLPLIFFVVICCSFLITSIIAVLSYSNPNKQLDIPSNKVVILSTIEDKLIISNFLKQKNRYLPIEENFYDIEWVSPGLFNEYKNYPSILMVKNEESNDSLLINIYDRVFKNRAEKSKVNLIENSYSDNQIILGLEVLDSLDLVSTLNDYSKSINKIDIKIENQILKKYMRIPQNKKLVDIIKNSFSIDMYIDHDYTIIKHLQDILWIGRGKPEYGDPYRWMVFKQIQPCANLKECTEIIQNTFNEAMSDSNSIKISEYNDSKTYKYIYKNNYIIGGTYTLSEIIKNKEGTYEVPIAGGPYISYILKRDSAKDLLVIGLVNNPGEDKMIYLKQFEAIFKNIKGE